MRTSRDRYSRKQHGFLQSELMETNSFVLLMAPPSCLCDVSLVTFPPPNSPVLGKYHFVASPILSPGSSPWIKVLPELLQVLFWETTGGLSPRKKVQEYSKIWRYQDLGLNWGGQFFDEDPVIPSDLPNISTDWARGKTHSISSERWSSGSWTWGTCMNQNSSPCRHYITGERFCLENNNTVKLKHLYLFWVFFCLWDVKWNCLYHFSSQNTLLFPAKADWRRPKLEQIEISRYLTVIWASPHGPLHYWGFAVRLLFQLASPMIYIYWTKTQWKRSALYLMGADQQWDERRTCLGSLWWERQDNH